MGVLALLGCSSTEEEFIGSRVEDACDGTWPVCATTAGCILGDRSYVSGRFPGTAKGVVQLFEPSEVTASLLLTEMASTGDETVFSFFEDRCRARIREAVTGKVLMDEAARTGIVTRSADLTGIGDHLVEITSDARMSYFLKVDVLPVRLKESPRE